MRKLIAMVAGASPLLVTSVVLAQADHMMEGGRHVGWFGGYGGFWSGVLLGVLVIAVLFLLFGRRRK